jgi:hypothetical protein
MVSYRPVKVGSQRPLHLNGVLSGWVSPDIAALDANWRRLTVNCNSPTSPVRHPKDTKPIQHFPPPWRQQRIPSSTLGFARFAAGFVWAIAVPHLYVPQNTV